MKRYSINFARLLSIVVLMAIGYAASAQNYYVFHNSTYGYIYNNNGTPGVKATFDESCLWIASGTIGNNNTYRSVKPYTDQTQYLKGASSAPCLSIGNESKSSWVGQNNYLSYFSTYNSNKYYLNYDGSSFSSKSSDYSNGFLIYSVTITNPIMPTFTFSQPAADGSSYIGSVSGTLSVVANVSGSYYPLYYSFNGHYYDEDFTSLGTSVPSGITNFNTTYELIDVSSYASISGNTITYTIDPGHDVVAQVKVTVNPQGYPDIIVAQEIRSFTLYSTNVVAPVITRIEGTNQYTITTTTANATIQYTTDGTDINSSASNGTTYSGPITVTSNGAVIKARAIRNGTVSDQTTYTVSNVLLLPPAITISSAGEVTITNPNTFASSSTIRYTTNGTDPTSSSPVFSNHTATNMQTIKAIVTASGYLASSVATAQYIVESGVSGNTVVLNDCEDHNWTYYSGMDNSYDYNTKYAGKLYSPNPRNVKITYYGKGRVAKTDAVNGEYVDISSSDSYKVQVGIDATANTFVYYKTLERDANSYFPYTTIPNPFSVRPVYGTNTTTKWRGFYKWRVKSVTNGSIYATSGGATALGEGAYLDADVEYFFRPSDYASTNVVNQTSMEVELEAVWVRAYVNTSNSTDNFVSKANGGWERNFVVYTSGTGNTATGNGTYPITYTALYPNGCTTNDGTTIATAIPNVSVAANAKLEGDVKLENIRMNGGNTLNTDAHNLWVVRGVVGTGTGGSCAGTVKGVNENKSNDISYKITLEAGSYGKFSLTDNTANAPRTFSGKVSCKAVFGCDYDRATSNNNSLHIAPSGEIWGGGSNSSHVFSDEDNRNNITFDWLIKSGKIQENVDISDAAADRSLYLATSIQNDNGSKYIGKRRLIMEGGEMASIAGGINCFNTTNDSYTKYEVNDGSWSVYIRIKFGTVRGSIYGAAAYSGANGDRYILLTGGDIKGWVAGGANGTQSDGGMLYGASYVYVGGDVNVNSENSNSVINRAVGGNVFGAGCGYSTSSTSGQVSNGTNVVLADNAYVQRGVYGGGSYGYTESTANVYILGGHLGGESGGVNGTSYNANIHGGLYGGACQNRGGVANIFMTGGEIEGGLYGGSNSSGTLSGNVTIQISGGQVGTTSAPANVHGGGYGNATRVSGSVNITVGISGATDGATIYGDVYGGSAEGKTNGNNARTSGAVTNVTFNAGTVNGNVYGGGLGTSAYLADVWGPVTVTVTGGEAQNIFGCNNTNGAPKNTVKVDMTGGLIYECVYGGGNAAAYTAPTNKTLDVTISGGEVKKNVFGGGLGASAKVTGTTNVTVKGTSTKVGGNVYGGGSAADVTGSTNVTIGEE